MDSFGSWTHTGSQRRGVERPPPVAIVSSPESAGPRASGWRGISRSAARRVKTPGSGGGAGRRASWGNGVFARRWTTAALVSALLSAAPAAAQEPLCEWLLSLGAAAQAQASGDAAAAEAHAARALRARPRGPAAARANAALGLALLARHEPAAAAEALEAALSAPVPGRAHLAFARAEALLAARDAPRAARLFAEAVRSGDLALSRAASLREAEALLASGLHSEAVSALEALLLRPDVRDAAPVRLALARALRESGDHERAAAALRSLWLEMPERAEGRAAGDALAAWRAMGGPVAPDSGAERAARAERLLAAGRPEEALAELDAAARADEPAAHPDLLRLLRAGALLALGRHADAEGIASGISNATDAAVQRGARLVLARAAARAGDVEAAARLYAEVGAGRAPIPGLPAWRQRDIGDEASFLAAWLFYDAGQYERAIVALERFARSNPRSRRAEDALWFAAWSRYRLGRTGDADRAFAALARGPLGDAALYWRARLAPRPSTQRALYRAALARGGDGWYGLLSRIRLSALGHPAARPPVRAAPPLPEAPDPRAAARLSVAVELLGLGLRDAALEELDDLSRSDRVRAAAPLVAQLASFAGECELPFRLARDHMPASRRSLRWLYPTPLPEMLGPSARRFGVDPALLLAVMRRESSFRRDVRSLAGAEGLLQLRPRTAERLAVLLGVPGGVASRLSDPATSISVGAHYLGLLLGRFEHPALAVAAYNAGPAAVADWARARSGMPLDAWVESIPYRETRQYVKTVLAEWDVYRSLSGEPPPGLDPDWRVAPPGSGVAF